MFTKYKIIQLVLIVFFLYIGIITISARGCKKSSNTKIVGSSNNSFMINAPSGLTVTVVSSSQINLSWQDNSNNEDGFEIWRSTDGINYTLRFTLNADTISYSDTGFSWATTYYYRVRALNSIGDRSEWSNEVSVVLQPIASVIAAGGEHTFALTTDGRLWLWGNNSNWQLGIGDTVSVKISVPTLIQVDFSFNSFVNITSVVGGYFHSVARKSDGTLWAWGGNGVGQLGLGDTDSREAPDQIGSDSDWSTIAVGISHTIALKTSSTLWAWGFNNCGQLGDGTQMNRWTPLQIGSDSDWLAIAGGGCTSTDKEGYTIALKTNPAGGGTLWAWGYNGYGQLGDGTYQTRTTPRQIGTESDWILVAAGATHTIGIKANPAGDRTLWLWGCNWSGQLGDGTTNNRTTPRQIGTESDWASVTAGYYYTIGIKANNTLWAWGANGAGQLGDGTTNNRTTPRQIGTESDWTRVAAGCVHTIGLKSAGTIWVWGGNSSGQLGLGDTIARNIPYPLGSPATPSLIATPLGLAQIALTWADNSNNETGFIIERSTDGINYTILSTLPAQGGTNTIYYLDTGLNPANTYYYRGYAYNSFGNSPYSTASTNFNRVAPSSLIATILDLSQIVLSWTDRANDETGFIIERKLNAGDTYQEIATVGSNAASWLDTPISPGIYYYYRVRAWNVFGNSPYSNEIAIATSGNWVWISAGSSYIISIKTNNTLWAWGYNNYGQLGDGTTDNRTTPRLIGTESDWTRVAAGSGHTIGIKGNPANGGMLWAWGYNEWGQLGDGTTDNRTTPRLIGTESDWTIVAGGVAHTIGFKTGGTLWVWGNNKSGQLGDGTEDNRITPRQIGTESDWVSVAAGNQHTIGIKGNPANGGMLWAWGHNEYGQLGDGTTNDRTTPRQIGTESDWVSVAAGNQHTIGIKGNPASGGTLWAWGNNECGQLGLGDMVNRNTPTQIGTNSDWSSVCGGGAFTFALKTNGTIWSWGYNNSGQLGLGDTINLNTPTQLGTQTDWTAISAGDSCGFAIKTSGLLWSWGYNGYGQLGVGDTVNRNIPTLVGE
jgi:alpha-tubulin suppressor-like RCC1 family protein